MLNSFSPRHQLLPEVSQRKSRPPQ